MNTPLMIFCILVILLGLAMAIFPWFFWYLRRGLWHRDSEPGDGALLLYRLLGAAILLLGVWLLAENFF